MPHEGVIQISVPNRMFGTIATDQHSTSREPAPGNAGFFIFPDRGIVWRTPALSSVG